MPEHRPDGDLERQDGIIIGNVVDKSNLGNPISRRLVANFDRCLLSLVDDAEPRSVHEVGCGEGRLIELITRRHPVPIRATDFSSSIVEALRKAQAPGSSVEYEQRSIYDLTPDEDSADLVICCEVLEHLERPTEALDRLRGLGARSYILSVPREPIWRVLNMARGKYLGALGNTPGHLQHWSRRGFLATVRKAGFEVLREAHPFPWTMVRAGLR